MIRTINLLLMTFIFSNFYSQSKNLTGKWILDRVQYENGKNLEINNPLYSTNITYTIETNSLRINEQEFAATFSKNQIKTEFRTINYILKDRTLITKDENDNKIYSFLTAQDFVNKYSEFSMKKTLRNSDTIYIANNLNDYKFENKMGFDEFIRENSGQRGRSSKSFNNLYFRIEFLLSKNNEIKDIKIINSIDTSYDNDYIITLRKAEKFLKNISGSDLLIKKEINHLKWVTDLNDKNELELHSLKEKGERFYNANNFNSAIESFSQIKNLDIKNNRFKTLIKQSMKQLGISYLAIGKKEEACNVFDNIGDKTDFHIRNYLIDFCSK